MSKARRFRLSRRQDGAVLLVSLIMLVLMTLFALTGIRLSSVNLRIIGNYQWQKETEILVDTALEQVLSDAANFSPTTTAHDICSDGTVSDVGNCPLLAPARGTVTAPACSNARPAEGYSLAIGTLVPEDSDWTMRATATDSATSGATVTIVRGVTARLLAGNCPD
jgi:hypothetical protein